MSFAAAALYAPCLGANKLVPPTATKARGRPELSFSRVAVALRDRQNKIERKRCERHVTSGQNVNVGLRKNIPSGSGK